MYAHTVTPSITLRNETYTRVPIHKDIWTTMFNTEVAIKGVCGGSEYLLILLKQYIYYTYLIILEDIQIPHTHLLLLLQY